MTDPSLTALYSEIAACQDNCPGIRNCPTSGDWPRGFYTETVPPVRVLAVLENPGPPNPVEVAIGAKLRAAPSDWPFSALAENSLLLTGNKMRAVTSNPPRSMDEVRLGTGGPHKITRAHRGLVYILSQVLEVDPAEVYKHAAHTNAVKCSGPTGLCRTHPDTVRHCGEKWLRREIDLYRPKLVLAIAGDSRFLLEQVNGFGIAWTYVQHPMSWRSAAVAANVPERLADAREALRRAEGNAAGTPPS